MATIEETPAVDGDKLMAFVFNAVDEVGGALNAALVVMGDRLGWYRAHGRRRAALVQPSSPSAPAPPSATSASGSTRRRPAASSSTTPRPGATRCRPSRPSRSPTARARPTCRGSSRSRSARSSTRRASPTPPRAAPASAGTSTTTTSSRAASASSGPATTRNLVAAWLPALDGVVEKLERGAQRRRPRLRPRLVDDPDGAGVPELDVRGLRLPRGLDRDGARARQRGRRRRSRDASRPSRPPTTRAPATTS